MQYAPGPSLHVESLQTSFAGQSSDSRQRPAPGADADADTDALGGSTPALGIVQVLDPPPDAVARQSAPCSLALVARRAGRSLRPQVPAEGPADGALRLEAPAAAREVLDLADRSTCLPRGPGWRRCTQRERRRRAPREERRGSVACVRSGAPRSIRRTFFHGITVGRNRLLGYRARNTFAARSASSARPALRSARIRSA